MDTVTIHEISINLELSTSIINKAIFNHCSLAIFEKGKEEQFEVELARLAKNHSDTVTVYKDLEGNILFASDLHFNPYKVKTMASITKANSEAEEIIDNVIEELLGHDFTILKDMDEFNKEGDVVTTKHKESGSGEGFDTYIRCESTNDKIDGSDLYSLQWFYQNLENGNITTNDDYVLESLVVADEAYELALEDEDEADASVTASNKVKWKKVDNYYEGDTSSPINKLVCVQDVEGSDMWFCYLTDKKEKVKSDSKSGRTYVNKSIVMMGKGKTITEVKKNSERKLAMVKASYSKVLWQDDSNSYNYEGWTPSKITVEVNPMNGKYQYKIVKDSGYPDNSGIKPIIFGYADTEKDAINKAEEKFKENNIEDMLNANEVNPVLDKEDVIKINYNENDDEYDEDEMKEGIVDTSESSYKTKADFLENKYSNEEEEFTIEQFEKDAGPVPELQKYKKAYYSIVHYNKDESQFEVIVYPKEKDYNENNPTIIILDEMLELAAASTDDKGEYVEMLDSTVDEDSCEKFCEILENFEALEFMEDESIKDAVNRMSERDQEELINMLHELTYDDFVDDYDIDFDTDASTAKSCTLKLETGRVSKFDFLDEVDCMLANEGIYSTPNFQELTLTFKNEEDEKIAKQILESKSIIFRDEQAESMRYESLANFANFSNELGNKPFRKPTSYMNAESHKLFVEDIEVLKDLIKDAECLELDSFPNDGLDSDNYVIKKGNKYYLIDTQGYDHPRYIWLIDESANEELEGLL